MLRLCLRSSAAKEEEWCVCVNLPLLLFDHPFAAVLFQVFMENNTVDMIREKLNFTLEEMHAAQVISNELVLTAELSHHVECDDRG